MIKSTRSKTLQLKEEILKNKLFNFKIYSKIIIHTILRLDSFKLNTEKKKKKNIQIPLTKIKNFWHFPFLFWFRYIVHPSIILKVVLNKNLIKEGGVETTAQPEI